MKTFCKVLANLILAAMYLVVAPLSYAQHVYVQTASGVTVYTTAMKKVGSYTPYGVVVGTTGKFLVTTRTGWLNSYALSSSGAIGKLVSDINTDLYSGSECGGLYGAVLDGQYVYTVLNEYDLGYGTGCQAVQTYEVSSSGVLTFKGGTEYGGDTQDQGLPIFSGNNKFAYETDAFQGFSRESSGALVDFTPSVTGPEGATVALGQLAPDPYTHFAGVVGVGPNVQLASYTVGTQGDLSSSNTVESMPVVTPDPGSNVSYSISDVQISPAGTVVAVAISTGIKFYHFNGSKPVTEFTGLIGSSGWIASMSWSGDTLYAVNGASGKLHVYTVTTSKVTENKGSPYSVGALEVFVK